MGGGHTALDCWNERKGEAELPAVRIFLDGMAEWMVVPLTKVGNTRGGAVLGRELMRV